VPPITKIKAKGQLEHECTKILDVTCGLNIVKVT